MTRIKQTLAIIAGVLAAMMGLGMGAVIIAGSLVVGAIMMISARLALSARPPMNEDARPRYDPAEATTPTA